MPLPFLLDLRKGGASRGMAQFQEVMVQQLESSMDQELEHLLHTASGAEKEVHTLRTSTHGLRKIAILNFEGLEFVEPTFEWNVGLFNLNNIQINFT